jgi:uncharacterized protein with GYD domain
MPYYLTQSHYTDEAWAALRSKPENRTAALEKLMAGLGCRLVAYYFVAGEHDSLIILRLRMKRQPRPIVLRVPPLATSASMQ